VIRFRLRKPGKVELVVRVAGADCSVIGRRRAPGRSGLNRVRFDGKVNGRPLGLGKYTITVVVVRAGRRTRVGTVAVEVVPPGRRLTSAQRTAPVRTAACNAAPTAPPAELLQVGSPLAAATGPGAAAKKAKPPASPHTSLRPPTIRPKTGGLGGDSGAFGWLAIVVYAVLGLTVAAALVQLTRFFRGTWNP
jgi:hypothetical protein